MNERKTIAKEKIIRTLLNDFLKENSHVTKYRLAKLSSCSYSTFDRILKQLQDEQFVKDTRVTNFLGLLMKWVESYYIFPKKLEYLVKDPINLLKNSKLDYALTTYYAENKVQKYLFVSRFDFWINPEDQSKWHDLIRSNDGLVGKGNTRIFVKDKHSLYNSTVIDETRIVSLPQLVADLYNEGGVCIEAANLLIQQMMENVISEL